MAEDKGIEDEKDKKGWKKRKHTVDSELRGYKKKKYMIKSQVAHRIG